MVVRARGETLASSPGRAVSDTKNVGLRCPRSAYSSRANETDGRKRMEQPVGGGNNDGRNDDRARLFEDRGGGEGERRSGAGKLVDVISRNVESVVSFRFDELPRYFPADARNSRQLPGVRASS